MLFNNDKLISDVIHTINEEHRRFHQHLSSEKSYNLKKLTVYDLYHTDNKWEAFMSYVSMYEKALNQEVLFLSNIMTNYDLRVRIKTQNSSINKVNRYMAKSHEGKVPVNKCLNDLLGFRLIIPQLDVESEELTMFLKTIKKDYSRQYVRKIDGYIGRHVYFKNGINTYFPWELQIWSSEQSKANEASHKKHKKTREYVGWNSDYDKGKTNKRKRGD